MRIIFILLLMCGVATADWIPKDKAVKAIIGEAEDQGYQGMKAVACAIRNRGTLKGVYGLNAPRVKARLYSADIEAKATSAWEESEDPEACSFIKGADHWENIHAFGKPYWASSMEEVYRHKDHVFFKRRKSSS